MGVFIKKKPVTGRLTHTYSHDMARTKQTCKKKVVGNARQILIVSSLSCLLYKGGRAQIRLEQRLLRGGETKIRAFKEKMEELKKYAKSYLAESVQGKYSTERERERGPCV